MARNEAKFENDFLETMRNGCEMHTTGVKSSSVTIYVKFLSGEKSSSASESEKVSKGVREYHVGKALGQAEGIKRDAFVGATSCRGPRLQSDAVLLAVASSTIRPVDTDLC
jgi:hypothetical protein